MSRLRRNSFAGFLILLCGFTAPIVAQYGAKNGEWAVFGGDPGSTRYSPLDQINRDNVQSLQVAWTFKTDNFAPAAVAQSQSTPIMVKGILYFTAGPRRNVVALDAGTGEIQWVTGRTKAPAAIARHARTRAASLTGPTDARNASSS